VSSTDVEHLEVRPATVEDADVMADVLVRTRVAATPAMPALLHDEASVRAHLRRRLAEAEGWLAVVDGAAAGFALADAAWLDMLYVLPGRAGGGIGSALLDVVKHARPRGFALWVFESNHAAREFYRRRGLVELERTDGSGNEERQPDVRMVWPGRDPMTYLRTQIDEVDAELATLVSRRTALTTEIQRHKPVAGHAGRDESREAEIAERMARQAPVLTAQEWRRIIHEVITVSLDAAERERP
jgi:chorismate mutase/GNAT superfamily N-acetyltransferase